MALRQELVELGCPCVGERLDSVLQFLHEQEFTCVNDFACTLPFVDMAGSDSLEADELHFLQEAGARMV